MKFLIVYSSKTGNTKKVAEALARVAPIGSEIHSIEEAGDADGFDVIFAGYWLDRGGVDEKMKKYLQKKLQKIPEKLMQWIKNARSKKEGSLSA